MNKKNVLIYRIVTGIFTALMLFSAGMYLFQNQVAVDAFTALGFPIYIIYPLAILKILGLVAIWTRKSKVLTEWAYAGFTFNTLLAISAHLNVGDGEFAAALVGLVLVLTSYAFSRKVYGA